MWVRVCLLYCLMAQAIATMAMAEPVSELYDDWQNSAVFINQTLDKALLQRFIVRAQSLSKQNPTNPQAWALSGQIKAFYASQIPSIEGLKMAKQARDDLQYALSLDPRVFPHQTYAELGYLYHNTPGWPFSFGSQSMAEKLLYKALELDPQGLMSNLRAGEFWFDQKNYIQAQKHLQVAVDGAAAKKQDAWIEFQLLQANQMLAKINK
jgi:tetratricopeptide (TPR) repeat protein